MRTHFCFSTFVGICLTVMCVQDINAETSAANLVAPAKADTIASPLTFRTIQTNTEADDSGMFVNSNTSPYTARVGVDTYISSRNKLYDSSISYAFRSDLQLQLNVPVVSAVTDSFSGDSKSETGLGDVRLGIKFKADFDENLESYFILTAKLATGDEEVGLGTGSYDFSFTHKSIVMIGNYRTTFMAGLTLPPPFDFNVLGSSVVYAPTISYMVATERGLSSTGFRFGIKAAGLHAFSSRINSVLQKNALTSLDIIPEVTSRLSDTWSIKGGIIVPVLTVYDLPGAANRRDPVFNLCVNASF